jgi:hypothetical protein
MEWLDGVDLGARLRRGRLSVDEALALVAGAAEALGSAPPDEQNAAGESRVPSMCRDPAPCEGTGRDQVGRRGPSFFGDLRRLQAKLAFRKGFPETASQGSIPGASTTRTRRTPYLSTIVCPACALINLGALRAGGQRCRPVHRRAAVARAADQTPQYGTVRGGTDGPRPARTRCRAAGSGAAQPNPAHVVVDQWGSKGSVVT